MSSEIAHREGAPIIPGTPEDRQELTQEVREVAHELDVVRRLTTYSMTLRETENSVLNGEKFFVLSLDPETRELQVEGFRDQSQATETYDQAERTGKVDTVLVSVESIAALRRAYPNYFLDTAAFLEIVKEVLQ